MVQTFFVQLCYAGFAGVEVQAQDEAEARMRAEALRPAVSPGDLARWPEADVVTACEQGGCRDGGERDIYCRYLQLVSEGKTDREARFQLTWEYGQSAEDDRYATVIDRIQAAGG